MLSATERREELRWFLSEKRFVRVQDIMNEFSIGRCTALRDLEVLSEFTPIETVQGKGGGIRVADGWYADRRYLNKAQEALLKSLYPGLQPEQQKVMESILAAIAKPQV